MGTSAPAPPTTTAGLLDFSIATQVAFNAAYWKSFPPVIAATFEPNLEAPHPINGPSAATTSSAVQVSYDTLKTEAIALAQQGHLIDVNIMLWGGDPYVTMLVRQNYGYTGVPALGEANVAGAPGVGGPANAGSIKVSTNIADYPPYPVPVIPANSTRSPVGPLLTGKTYMAYEPESSPYLNGQIVSFNGVSYQFVFPSIFGPAPMWIAQ